MHKKSYEKTKKPYYILKNCTIWFNFSTLSLFASDCLTTSLALNEIEEF